MNTGLDLSLAYRTGITVVQCRGEIDLDSRSRLADCLRNLEGTVEVDLAGVTFLDSSGIATLVTAHKALLAAGGKLRLANPQDNVRRVLEIVGLSDWIDQATDARQQESSRSAVGCSRTEPAESHG